MKIKRTLKINKSWFSSKIANTEMQVLYALLKCFFLQILLLQTASWFALKKKKKMQTKCCQKRIKFSFPTDGGCFAAVALSETSSHLICSLSDLHLNKQKETQKATKQNTVTTVTIKTNTRAHKQNILTAKKQEQTKNLFWLQFRKMSIGYASDSVSFRYWILIYLRQTNTVFLLGRIGRPGFQGI